LAISTTPRGSCVIAQKKPELRPPERATLMRNCPCQLWRWGSTILPNTLKLDFAQELGSGRLDDGAAFQMWLHVRGSYACAALDHGNDCLHVSLHSYKCGSLDAATMRERWRTF
jgi:hypothetical protein